MKYLVIGAGSIGNRHIRNIAQQDSEAVFILVRSIAEKNQYVLGLEKDFPGKIIEVSTIQDGLSHKPDAALITNPTAHHVQTALHIMPHIQPILLEKPVSHNLEGLDTLSRQAQLHHNRMLVAYTLRFHPILKKVKELLDAKVLGRIYTCRAISSSYMPHWQPGRDYTQSFRSQEKLGGGVILDLSHEVDYCLWFFGQAQNIKAAGGKLSDLKVDVEDTAELLITHASGVISSVHIDFVGRETMRNITIIGENGNLYADVVKKTIQLALVKGDKIIEERFDFSHTDPQQMYIDEITHFLRVIKGEKPAITLDEGKAVMDVCMKAKQQVRV